MQSRTINRFTAVAMAVALVALSVAPLGITPAKAQGSSRLFPETGHTVSGRFLEYWNSNGGIPQYGYPLSEPIPERSDTDGKNYVVQYFERAVFEAHPENQAPNDVLLSLLGVYFYKQRYGGNAPLQLPNSELDAQRFPETGMSVGGRFLQYWRAHGDVAQFGLPISEEMAEVSGLNGHTYKVQYFQRGEMEFHPENQAPYDVLLTQLGTLKYKQQYGSGTPGPSPTPAPPPPTATPVPSAPPAPTATPTPSPSYKIKLTLSNTSPRPGDTVTVTGKLTSDGGGVPWQLMMANWELKGNRTLVCKDHTAPDGTASCSRNIGPAVPGEQVKIYVSFTTPGGGSVESGISFTVRR
jgi:hypothetical protein